LRSDGSLKNCVIAVARASVLNAHELDAANCDQIATEARRRRSPGPSPDPYPAAAVNGIVKETVKASRL